MYDDNETIDFNKAMKEFEEQQKINKKERLELLKIQR